MTQGETSAIAERNPWGASAQSALRWAFALLASGNAMPSILGDLRGPTKVKRELAILELRAQGAQIRAYIDAFEDPITKAYLIAFYLPHPMEERMQGGGIEFVDRFGSERDGPEQALAMWLLAQQGTGVHRIRGYREIVAQHCLGDRMIGRIRLLTGRSMGIDRIQGLLKMDRNKVGQRREECIRLLLDLAVRAHYQADNRLYEAGLI
jgi:hypothetical protein